MNVSLESVLHPRVLKHCKQLFVDGHYKHAALEAMIQVELALKEKADVKNKYGVNLVTSLFGEGKGIKLRVPFGNDMQRQAETLFKGAFAYYRNYLAHDGRGVDSQMCFRVMVLASELLDLIGASELSFADVGGVSGLVKAGVFSSSTSLRKLLHLLDGFTLRDDDPDWLLDLLDQHGYTLVQVHALIDTGLVEYLSEDYIVPPDLVEIRDTLPDTVGWFERTKLGKKVTSEIG